MKNKTLCKGVDLHIIDAPKFKTNHMGIYFNIPFNRETVTKAALLPSVMNRGSEKYPTIRELSRKLDDLYSASVTVSVRPKGDGEMLCFSAEYISDKYVNDNISRQIAEFMYQFIFEPLTDGDKFSDEYVKSEKINLKNEIEGLINDKKEYAEFKCREAMFEGKGCGMQSLGYIEDLSDITSENLYSFYKDVISSAKADIFISGTVDDSVISDIESAIKKGFTPREADYIKSEIAPYKASEVSKVIEDTDTVQSKLCMGLICGVEPDSDEYYSLVLASAMYGGTPFSKLFNNVREKLSLAYYAVARTHRFNSFMIISSGIQTENYQTAYDEILRQLNKMKNGEFDDFEIDAAKKYLKNAYNSLNDSITGMEDYYLSQAILKQNTSLSELIDKIYDVKRDDIINVMNKIQLDTVYFLKGKTE